METLLEIIIKLSIIVRIMNFLPQKLLTTYIKMRLYYLTIHKVILRKTKHNTISFTIRISGDIRLKRLAETKIVEDYCLCPLTKPISHDFERHFHELVAAELK